MKQNIIVICGPTASGKSNLSLDLAQRLNAEIVNADSMQIYRDIPILSAQPSRHEREIVPHHLYGIMESHESCSVGRYIELVVNVINEIHHRNKIAIIVGGTGLYLKSLIYGLAEIPEIEPQIRQGVRDLLAKIGNQEFYQKLLDLDGIAAKKISPSDPQRMLRAMEVIKQTGISITKWQNHNKAIFAEDRFALFTLDYPREVIYRNINKRFELMVKHGAIDEVRKLLALNISEDLPINKAIGIKELGKYLKQELAIEEAIMEAQTKSRQYAKRQMTWFRHQLGNSYKLTSNGKEALLEIENQLF